MSRKHFEDCKVGDKVTAPGRTITESDVVSFASLTTDWNPLHTDAEFAKAGVFGERIAHGMLVLSVGSAPLMRMGEGLLPESTVALYDVEKVRFRAPTRLGDTIRAEGEIVEASEINGERGMLTIRGTITNQRDETVITFKVRAVVGRRPGR